MSKKNAFKFRFDYFKPYNVLSDKTLEKHKKKIKNEVARQMQEQGLEMLDINHPVFIATLIAEQPHGTKEVKATTGLMGIEIEVAFSGLVYANVTQIISHCVNRVAHNKATINDPTLMVWVTDDCTEYAKLLTGGIVPMYQNIVKTSVEVIEEKEEDEE